MTTVSPWPGTDVMLFAGGLAWVMHRLACHLGRVIGGTADAASGRGGYDVLAVHVVTMIAQLPVILVYGMGLAARIAI